jgi:plastocyanin
MKRLNAAIRFACLLATTLTMVFFSQAESGNRHLNTAPQKQRATHVIRILDQKGRPAVSGVPSGTGQIVDVSVGPGFVFVPDEVNISVGDTVRWTWAGNGHSVTSGDPCTTDGQFCSPDDTNCDAGTLSNTGTVYEHTFAQAGTYSYFCFAHCAFGMTGVVNVSAGPTPTPTPTPSGLLYGSTGGDNVSGGGRLWLINVTNQSAHLIGDTGFNRLSGIAFDSNGNLYGVSGGAVNPCTLLAIDRTNGNATVIGPISDPTLGVDGLRFNSLGVLYGAAWDTVNSVGKLLTIDPSTGNILSSLTLLGNGDSFCAGIAFDSKDLLYGSRGNGSRDEDIDLIDPVTGVMTPIGPLETIISDVVFSSDGTLYASSPTGDLYTVDPVTGVKTLLFNTGIAQLSGLAAAPMIRPTPTPRPRPTPHPRPTP